jgi:hypothetical protein
MVIENFDNRRAKKAIVFFDGFLKLYGVLQNVTDKGLC